MEENERNSDASENSFVNSIVIPPYSIWEKRENAFESPRSPPPSYAASELSLTNLSEFGGSTLRLTSRENPIVIIRNYSNQIFQLSVE